MVNPNQQALERWAEEKGVTGDFTALCENSKAKEYILEEITKVAKSKKVELLFIAPKFCLVVLFPRIFLFANLLAKWIFSSL